MSLEMDPESKKVDTQSTSAGLVSMDFEPAKFSTFKRKGRPIRIVWTDIEYTVKKKTILKKISGEANPGEVVALMGVSAHVDTNPQHELT